MTTILYFKHSEKSAAKAKLAGVRHGARALGWRVQTVDTPRIVASSLRRLVSFWDPQGVIIDCGGSHSPFPLRTFGRLPVVFLDNSRNKARQGDFFICHDPVRTAELAARELLSLGLSDFGFVGLPESCTWAEERARAFQDAIRLNGGACRIFQNGRGSANLTDFVQGLRAWLTALPKPCGIFATNDFVGEIVLNTCEAAGIRVPEEISVIGVDNDEPLCENIRPSLTSILPDFEAAGFLAVKTMAARFHSPQMKPVQRSFGPLMVIRRGSTHLLHRKFPHVEDALALIRERACEGLRSRDVVACMKVSRRLAEMRFREMRGHSILDEIQSVRIERARQLLQTSHGSIKTIANMCGYSSEAAFRKTYQKILHEKPFVRTLTRPLCAPRFDQCAEGGESSDRVCRRR